MTMNCGSFCCRILAPWVDSHIAPKIDPTTIATASGKLLTAIWLSASENGMATEFRWSLGAGENILLPRQLRKTVRLFGEICSSGCTGSRLYLCQSLDYFQQLARATTSAKIAVAASTMLH